MEDFKYALGLEVEDKITGFKGIIRYRVQYLTGCNQYGVQPPLKDGDIPDARQIDENSISILSDGISKTFYEKEEKKKDKTTGGPNSLAKESH